MQPWDRQPKETEKAYVAFSTWLKLPLSDRTVPAAAKALKKKPVYKKTIEKWKTRFEWNDRAQHYDSQVLQNELGKRQETIERIRQHLLSQALTLADQLVALGSGKLGKERGDIYEHDEVIVKPSTRLQALIKALELAGITTPKRLELTGPDGSDLLAARDTISGLTDAQLAAVIAAADNAGDGA